MWHVFAILLTAVLVLSGFDWWFFVNTRGMGMHPIVWIAGIGGFFAPVLVPVVLYLWGDVKKKPKLVRTAGVMGQAVLVAYIISSAYKAFTGRTQPEMFTTIPGSDISHHFDFGFWQNGIFNGWPSSHAAIAVASAVALWLAWPNPVVRTLALLWAVLVCVGAAIGFHWFSDVAAGIVIGALVGFSVWESKFLK